MPVLCTKTVATSFYQTYTPPDQMLKRLNGLNKNTSLHWELTDDQLKYIKKHYPSYKVTPLVYIIKTALEIENTSNAPSIIKKINKSAKRGKSFIRSSLKKSEIDILKELNIFYKPVKYLITSL